MKSDAPSKFCYSRPLSYVVMAAVTATTIASMLGHLGGSFWVVDLFNHFRVQYAAVLGLALPVALWLRLRTFSIVAAAALVLNLAAIAPYYDGTSAAQAAAPRALTLLHFNVLRTNSNRAAIARYLDRSEADIVLVEEVDPTWLDVLQRHMPAYAPALEDGRDDSNFGIAMYVRRDAGVRVESARLLRMDGSWDHPSIEAQVNVRGFAVSLLGVHLHPPLTSNTARVRAQQIRRVKRWSQAQSGPRVVFGDLNTTPWSKDFEVLTRQSGLRDARLGRGVLPSWFPLGGLSLGLPLDHVLYSPQLEIASFTRGPGLQSDHRPVLAALRPSTDSGL